MSRKAQQLELKTGRVMDIEGYVDESGIRYLGSATELMDGTWRVLADIEGMLCVVEVRIYADPD